MTILGIGTERLKKAENTAPDLRHGKQERPTSAERILVGVSSNLCTTRLLNHSRTASYDESAREQLMATNNFNMILMNQVFRRLTERKSKTMTQICLRGSTKPQMVLCTALLSTAAIWSNDFFLPET